MTFANDERCEGKNAMEAALSAGHTRLRPVLMTALAMIIGMLPMSLGLGEGGEQNAPLGRAVIGGLLVATRRDALLCAGDLQHAAEEGICRATRTNSSNRKRIKSIKKEKHETGPRHRQPAEPKPRERSEPARPGEPAPAARDQGQRLHPPVRRVAVWGPLLAVTLLAVLVIIGHLEARRGRRRRRSNSSRQTRRRW